MLFYSVGILFIGEILKIFSDYTIDWTVCFLGTARNVSEMPLLVLIFPLLCSTQESSILEDGGTVRLSFYALPSTWRLETVMIQCVFYIHFLIVSAIEYFLLIKMLPFLQGFASILSFPCGSSVRPVIAFILFNL